MLSGWAPYCELSRIVVGWRLLMRSKRAIDGSHWCCEARGLLGGVPLLVRFKGDLGRFSRHRAGSSTSCRCLVIVAARPSMLVLGAGR